MTRLIVAAARRFGRFAHLLFIVPAFAIFAMWLALMDDFTVWFLATAIIAIPLAMLAIASLAGMLFAGLRGSQTEGISRDDAPGLWSAWENAAGQKRARGTVITVEDDLNAWVATERPLFGLRGTRTILGVGIPLLAFMDEDALGAILAHEEAHLRHKDTNGGLNLAEFEQSLEFVFEYADPERTVTGKVLDGLLSWLAPTVHKEGIRLSRLAEHAADVAAGKAGSGAQMARSLVLISAATQLAFDEVHEPLKRELMGAIKPPRPPLERLLEKSRSLTSSEQILKLARRAADQPEDPDGTHPPVLQRLRALGEEFPEKIDPVKQPALNTMLGEAFAAASIRRLNDDWTRNIAEYLER